MTDTEMPAPAAALLTIEVVTAYLGRNPTPIGDLPTLIASVHAAVSALGAPAVPAVEPVARPSLADIRKSITPDALISFIDGRSYKSMRRHLTKHGLTPETYREKYGLPADYPVVTASYSAQRSELAKALGLGQQRSAQPVAQAA